MDAKQLASFKSGKIYRGKFLGEMIIICLGKIYLGIITSAMLPLLVHALSTIPLNPSGSLFQTPRPVRKIILETLFHGRVPRTVALHHRLLGMPLYQAGLRDFQLEKGKVNAPENELVELSLSDVELECSHGYFGDKESKRSPPKARRQSPEDPEYDELKFLNKSVTQILLRR